MGEVKPSKCGECRCFCDPPRCDGPRTPTYTCNPRGTRWRLMRRADQDACGSIHAVSKDDDGTQLAAWGSQ